MKRFVSILTMAAALGALPLGAVAQSVPLHFGNQTPLRDEFGDILAGTAKNPGALVQIMRADNGIFPPGLNGAPHPDNPLISTARIGQGTDPTVGSQGLVSGSINLNREGGPPIPIFARIFNRPTAQDSTFYQDSAIYHAPTWGHNYGVFIIDAGPTLSELNEIDSDGDGLSDSWELSLGTDPFRADTDGDGISDYDEWLAGTDPLDPDDFLQMVQLIPAGGNDLTVQWSSVPGKIYQVEYTTDSLIADEVTWTPLYGPVNAVTLESSVLFTNGLNLDSPNFRVRLITP